MNQDSFRKLIETAQAGPSKATAATSGITKKAPESLQPIFKPRNVKKEKDHKYRDRAAERRTGDANDYAEVEALLEDFERRTARNEDRTAVEQQRRYLGGDGDHSILVKGLDIALLEQNKARTGLSTEDDDSLEKAFLEVASKPTTHKKKTREDLIRELKEKRNPNASDSTDQTVPKVNEDIRSLEQAKKSSKFKPIGAPANEKSKRKRDRDKDGDKKKKRKGESENKTIPTEEGITIQADNHQNSMLAPAPAHSPQYPLKPPAEPESKTVDEDCDIFADVGEYEGYDLDDEDDDRKDDDNIAETGHVSHAESPGTLPAVGRWFIFEETEKPGQIQSSNKDVQMSARPTTPLPEQTGNEEGEQEEQMSGLVPLTSSVMPDIKDFLAMDAAEEAMEKRRMRKEKRKGGKVEGEKKKLGDAAKVDRDFKKLQSHTEKKTAGS